MAFLPLRFTVSAKRRWLAGALISLAPSVLLFAQSASGIKEAQLCSISGIVVDSSSGAPIGKADIWLEPVRSQNAEAAAAERPLTRSSPDGRFRMLRIQPGNYRLKARRSGYLELAYGALRPDSAGKPLYLQGDKPLTDLTIRLTPGGAISGTIRDSDGEALEGTRVVLVRASYETGFPVLRRISTAQTDDRGEYRLYGLEEGRYYVAVDPVKGGYGLIDRSGPNGSAGTEALTLYPGVSDLSQATQIEIVAGRRVTGIDVRVVPAPVFRVRGRVENGPPPTVVELSDAKNLKTPKQVPVRKGSGEFEFSGVSAGSYYLRPNLGDAPVIVNGSDVDGVQARYQPFSTIEKVRVTADPPLKTDPPDFAIQISKATLAFAPSFSAAPPQGRGGGANAAMRGVGVQPGEYRVIGFSGRELRQYYVKSAHAEGVDILSQTLNISPGAAVEIAVVLAADGAKVGGAVRGEKDQPAPHATVLLAPETRDRMYLFRTATTDEQGRYEFPAVPPGKYKIFAWENPEPGIWFAPGFLKSYESQGQAIALEPKESQAIDVRVSVRPDA